MNIRLNAERDIVLLIKHQHGFLIMKELQYFDLSSHINHTYRAKFNKNPSIIAPFCRDLLLGNPDFVAIRCLKP